MRQYRPVKLKTIRIVLLSKADCMKRKFGVLLEKDEDGYYVASVPMLPGCHTQAKSMDDLLERIKEAIEAYLEAEKDIEISEFLGVQVVEAEAGGC
ncbi:MAG: type II toxin-antitoxin system HicB family antitoxin [Syntrophomonas sp.]|nr:type II toxin-antitoxin system HicB family antitoxin [Syntrophomonas sp.]